MIRWLIYRLAERAMRRGNWKMIRDREDRENYLARIFLLGSDLSTGFRLCVHVMLKSDQGGLHDHPFAFLSWVLVGGFWERLTHHMVWRRPGTFYFRGHHTFHRVEVPPGHTAVTLVLMFPRLRFGDRSWGFLVGRHWMFYQSYLTAFFGRSYR